MNRVLALVPMRFDFRVVDDHMRGETIGDKQAIKMRAKVDLVRQQ